MDPRPDLGLVGPNHPGVRFGQFNGLVRDRAGPPWRGGPSDRPRIQRRVRGDHPGGAGPTRPAGSRRGAARPVDRDRRRSAGQPALVRPLGAPRHPARRPVVRRRARRRARAPGALPGRTAARRPARPRRGGRPGRHRPAGRGRDRQALAAGVLPRPAATRGAAPRSRDRVRQPGRLVEPRSTRPALRRSLRASDAGCFAAVFGSDPLVRAGRPRGWQRKNVRVGR